MTQLPPFPFAAHGSLAVSSRDALPCSKVSPRDGLRPTRTIAPNHRKHFLQALFPQTARVIVVRGRPSRRPRFRTRKRKALYEFRQLSPADFEDLTRDLLQAEWGVRLEAFKTGRDQGIDLRYAAIPGETTIIQCKHYAGSTIATLVRHLRTKERPKVE